MASTTHFYVTLGQERFSQGFAFIFCSWRLSQLIWNGSRLLNNPSPSGLVSAKRHQECAWKNCQWLENKEKN